MNVLTDPLLERTSTPKLVIDDNLIISISARTRKGLITMERLHKSLVHQFENRGYGKFIDFLGTLRPKVLNAFSTSKERADYFENLIDYAGVDGSSKDTISAKGDNLTNTSNTCCLRMKQSDCHAECLFNWVLQGKLNKASKLSERLLT